MTGSSGATMNLLSRRQAGEVSKTESIIYDGCIFALAYVAKLPICGTYLWNILPILYYQGTWLFSHGYQSKVEFLDVHWKIRHAFVNFESTRYIHPTAFSHPFSILLSLVPLALTEKRNLFHTKAAVSRSQAQIIYNLVIIPSLWINAMPKLMQEKSDNFYSSSAMMLPR